MTTVLSVSVLLLGSWVLDAPAEDAVQPGIQQPAAATNPATIIPPEFAPRKLAPAVSPPLRGGNDPRLLNGERQPGSLSSQLPSERINRGAALPGEMPLAPTGAAQPTLGELNGWTPPTSAVQTLSRSRLGAGAAGRASQAEAAWMRMPVAPTASRSEASDSAFRPSSHATISQNRPANPTTGAAYFAVPKPLTQKPFVDYRPTSGVSPYLNLFRNDTALGTVGNYTTMVRPELEQRYFNQQVGRDIFGLERDSREHRNALQQMERASHSLQGVATPQFYMNYGDYFPSSSGQYDPQPPMP